MKTKIIFLLASISQPRCLKRVRSFKNKGFEVEVYGFDRGVYNVNTKNKDFDIHNLGFAPSGSGYFKKLFFAKKSLSKIFKKHANSEILYYTFSFDIALITMIYGKKYVYEISDLVYGYFNSRVLRYIFKIFDRFLISKSKLTVMTSEGFKKYLYPKKNINKIIVQPNRIDPYFYDIPRSSKKLDYKNLVFSYVGAFRYPNTVFRFAEIIGKKYPQHSFYFYGDSYLTSTVKKMADKYENIVYFGEFKNPQDLNNIYQTIDVVVACYDTKDLNERIAEPNKLYESIFFNKPIIVSNNTFLAKQVVEKYKCGFAINASNDYDIIEFLDSLNNDTLNDIKYNLNNIQLHEMIDDDSLNIINALKKNKIKDY